MKHGSDKEPCKGVSQDPGNLSEKLENQRNMNQIEDNSHVDSFQRRMDAIWTESENSAVFNSIDVEGDWKIVRAQMTKNTAWKPSGIPLFGMMLRIAAVFLLASGIGFVFYRVLTLQKTETVRQYTYEAGEAVRDLQLPDGTAVTLNAGSILTYSEGFNVNSRDVVLHGEGLFDVTSGQDLSFRVYTGESMVEVTGTTFSVSESDGMVKVEVMEGEVTLSCTDATATSLNQVNISRNQSGFMLSNNELVVRDGLEPNTLSWKTGRLIFDETPLDSAFADIAHHFRKELLVEEGLDVKITAEFEHQPLHEILDELEQVTGLAFDTTGGSLIVRK